MKQRLVPSGSASTSAIHVDVNYRRGPQECSQTLHSYRDVEIVVYHPGAVQFFYFLYTFSFYISFSGVDKKNQIPCMHPLIPSQNLFVSLLADTRISLTIISFGKSITIMINIRRIMCLWLIKNVEQGKKFPVPTRNRTSDLHILLQCFSTETQRLNGELGLLCDLITTRHQAQSFFFFSSFFLLDLLL